MSRDDSDLVAKRLNFTEINVGNWMERQESLADISNKLASMQLSESERSLVWSRYLTVFFRNF